MLNAGPELISILANNGDVVYAPYTAGQTPSLHTAPRELDLLFNQSATIDPTTLGGIQVVSAGTDGKLNTTDDVPITPGFVGLGSQPNEVVLRFSQSLPDNLYQVTLVGKGPQALTDSNVPPDPFNSGNPAQPNLQVAFKVDAGPHVLSVVPEPVQYDPSTGLLKQANNEIDVYFDKSIQSLPQQFGQLDPQLFQLIYTSNTATTADDISFNPTSVSFDSTTNKATLLFGTPLEAIGSGAFRLRIGNDQSVSGDRGVMTPTVVSVPEPAGGTYSTATTVPYNNGKLDQNPLQDNQVVLSSQLGTDNIDPGLGFPGGNAGPGVRNVPTEQHIDLSTAVLPAPKPGTIPTITYNFPDIYASTQGTGPLHNVITAAEESLARDIFQLYSYYLGVQFREVSSTALGAADLGIVTGVTQAVDANSPSSLPADNGRSTYGNQHGYLAVMNASTFNNQATPYGGAWFQAAMQQVGHLLGLGNDAEGPPGTIMGLGLNDPATGQPAEPVFPGNADILHGQYLYRPLSDNVDLYTFTVSTPGQFSAETIAQRLISSVINLPQTGSQPVGTAVVDGSTFTVNDGVHAPVTFEFAADGRTVTDGNVAIAYHSSDTAQQVAVDVAAAINGVTASGKLSTQATVLANQVALSGLPKLTASGNQGQVTYGQQPSQLNSVLTLYNQTNVIQVADTGTSSSGQPNGIGAALYGSTFTLSDGVHPAVTFQYARPWEIDFTGQTGSGVANDTISVTQGTATSTFEFVTNAAAVNNGKLPDGNYAIVVAPNASAQALASAAASAIDAVSGAGSHLASASGNALFVTLSTTSQLVSSPNFTVQGPGNTAGDVPVEFVSTATAEQLAVAIANAVNGNAATSGLNATANVQFEQVVLGGPLTVTSSGGAGQVTYTVQRQIISRNDDYFGTDSFVRMQLAPGIYYLAVTSTGNTQFDPNVAGSGSGGTTQGPYDLKLDFTPASQALKTLTDTDGNPLHGNSDGTSGGAYDFWFNVGSTIFVDKTPPPNSAASGQPLGSVFNPYTNLAQALRVAANRIVAPAGTATLAGQTFTINDGTNTPVTFEFVQNGQSLPAGDFNVPVKYNVGDSAAAVAQAIVAAINSSPRPLFVTPTYYNSDSEFESAGTETSTTDPDVDENVIDLQVPAQGNAYVDLKGAPALLAGSRIVRVLGTAGADNSIGVPVFQTSASSPPSPFTVGNGLNAGNTFQVTAGSVSATFEFTTSATAVKNGMLADGNFAVLVAQGASAQAIAAAMAQAINASPLARITGGAISATVSPSASAGTNGEAWWITLTGVGAITINAQNTPSLLSVSNAAPYEIGTSQFGGALTDGSDLTVPQGVTVMVDAGAVFKLEGTNVTVGESMPGVDYSQSALQVLGTPTSSVFFTSFHDNAVGTQTDTVTAPNAGDWGGIVFGPGADLEGQGVFLDTVNNARLTYGGGTVSVNGVLTPFTPIYLDGSRPAITNNTILQSHNSAISADPNSFGETIFGGPAYDPSTGASLPLSQAYISDYERAGPDIQGNRLSIVQSGPQTINAVSGDQIVQGETFVVFNPSNSAAPSATFEFVNSEALPPGGLVSAGSVLPDGNYAVLFSPGQPANGTIAAVPADTAAQVAAEIAAAINAAKIGVTASVPSVPANSSQVVVTGVSQVTPSSPTSFTAPDSSTIVDGETFVVRNLTTGVTATFEFNSTGSAAAGHVLVAFTSGDSSTTVAGEMAAAINGVANLGVLAVVDGSQVVLSGAVDFQFGSLGSGPLGANPRVLTTVAGNALTDGSRFQIINNRTGATTTFQYQLNTDTPPTTPSGNIIIIYSLADQDTDVANETAGAINAANLGVSAVVSGNQVSLIETPSGQFVSPLSVQAMVVANTVNGLFVRTQDATTQLPEALSVSARWTATDIPYVLSDNLVIQGNPGGPLDGAPRLSGRLDVDPGVTVKLGGAHVDTQMGANLIAEGTAADPIVFTSLHDDSYGGGGTFDTDGDNNNTSSAPALPKPGDWSGLYFGPTSRGSLDHTLIAYGGGGSTVQGNSDNFNAIEIHQAAVRVADSTIENNAAGLASDTRAGLEGNDSTTVFVLGAQPTIVNNVFQNNQGATISINADAMSSTIVPDPGRSTGAIDRFAQFDANRGPLVRLNQIGNTLAVPGVINGMVVRGGTLDTSSVWDDTDIVHVVKKQVQVPNVDSRGGLLLESSANQSLVVKFDGASSGLTATGTPLDITNRIGGSVQIVGTPSHPVVLTALSDETVGAGLTPQGKSQTLTDNGVGLVQQGQALLPTVPEVNRGTTIDNDVATNVVGHFEAKIGPGGDMGTDTARAAGGPFLTGITAQGRTQFLLNQNFVFDYANYVDPGSTGPATRLSATTIDQAPTRVAPDVVVSKGHFTGKNATINWTVTSSFKPGSTQMVNQVAFSSAQALGDLRFINYLDEDVPPFPNDDLLFVQGTPGQPGFQVFTIDGPQRVGLSQSGVYQAGPQLVNATYDGWAADSFDNLQLAIAANGGTFTVPGNINTTNLPPMTDPQLGRVFGPADQTTAFAWNVDPNASTSLITTFLNEVSGPATPPGGQWNGITLNQYSNDRNVAVVNEAESANTGGVGTNDTPATAQPLGQLAPNQKSGDDTQRLGFVVNGSISTPSDADVYTFKAQPGTQVWMSLGNTSPGLDSVLELVDGNGTVLARSDNALAESENPSLLSSSASGSAGFAGNLAMPLNASTLLLGNNDPTDPSLSNTVYDPASQANPGLRNLLSTNPLDAGFRVVLPGNPNSPTPQDYYVRVRSRGPDLTNLHSGLSSGAYQLQVRLQEQEEFPGSTVQYADIRFAKNGVDIVGLPAHSPLLGETGQAGTAQNTDASSATQPDPRPTAQDLGDPLTTDQGATSVAGNLPTPTTVTWYKFELNSGFLNTIQGLNAGEKTWSTIFDVDYADGLSRPNTTISVFDSSGKLIYIGRDSNIADDQPTPNSANGLTDLTHGSAGQLDPYIGSVQLPAGAYSFVDISAAATGKTIAGDTITVTFNGVTKTFEFTTTTLPAGDPNTAITVATTDTPPVLASEASQVIDNAFSNPNFVTLNGTRLSFPNGSVADTSGALVTTSNTYYVAISSDAALPQALDATFTGGSTNTLVRLEPVDSVNRIVEDHIGSQGGETAQPPGTLTPMFNGTVDTTNFTPNKPTPAQLQQVQSLNAGAVPFTLGDVVLFVDQKEAANGVPGHLETVNPFTGGLVTDIGPTAGNGLGYDDIAMRNDGRLYAVDLGPGLGQFDQIDTGTATATRAGTLNILVAGNAGVQVHALAFDQNGLNRELFAVGSFAGIAGGPPPFRNGFYQLDPNTGTSLNNPPSTPKLLNPSGVSANETITGMADVSGTLYAVTDAGGLYVINNPTGAPSVLFVAAIKDANGNPVQFTALTAGPPDVAGGAYANDLFATDAQGKLYALSTSGALLPVFAGGATSVSMGTTNVIGLAFSTLDYNLWHVTAQRGNDPGHGINTAPDNSRNPGSANQPQAGNLSFYFGMEDPAAAGTIDVPGTTTPQSLQPGAANYATNLDNTNVNEVYNTYNLPGGALGTLETNSFSLANYTYGDKPTLYFNYFLATQNASSTTQNPGTMLDSARVFVSADNGKTWQMLATNDPSRQQANVAQVDGELPSFASASSSAYPNSVVPQRIQQLYDTAGGTWRQARVDLGDFTGRANLKLRFDFSSAGSMNQGLPGDSFGNFDNPARGQDNRHEGFYVDDITVGLAERGEMVTGAQSNMTFVQTPQNPNTNAPTQILTGPYQLDIRRGTEYGVNVNPITPDISLIHSFDTNDRLVDGFSILAPAGTALSDGQAFQVSDGTHIVTFEFDQGDTLTVAGTVVNNDSFTINDGTTTKQFVFVVNGNPLNPPPKQPNQVQIFVRSTDSAAVVASDIANAINGSGLAVRAVTNVDPAYTSSLAAGQVRILATGAAVPQVNVSGAPELQSTIALHGGTPIAYAPGYSAAQVANAITNAINANTTLVGVSAGDVQNLINGVLTTTGNRVDLFGVANVVALNALAGQLTVSAASHTLTETGQAASAQVTISRTSAPGASLATPVSVQVQALDLIRYDQNATTGAFSLGTGEPSTNVQLVNPATNQVLQPGSPLTVLIPAGQSSVTFTVQAVEQTGQGGAELADGPVKVQLVATALGYSSGGETVDVADDAQVTPTLTLALTDPASGTILENAGPGAAHATVTRNSPDDVPLTVTLTSLDPGSARVPATVTIPAGSFSASFPIDAVDDNVLRQQAVNVTIVASAVNFVSGTTSVAVQDDGDQTQIPQNTPAWQSQGPTPITGGQDENVVSQNGSAQNPVSGAIETVLANPTNPDILYVGTVNGGVWESTNATSASGPTWTPLTDTMPSLSIGALQFDTTDTSYQHLIAGIGRFSSFANAGGQLSGLMVSSNGGQTWSTITPSASSPATPVGQNISGVAQRGNVLLAAANNFFNNAGGLFRSTDGGATFNLLSGQTGSGLPAGAISDLVGDPLDTKRFYAAVLTKGIFTSDDNGATWTDVTPSGLKSILNANPLGDNIRIADSGASVYFGYEKFNPLIGGTQLAAIDFSPAANLSSSTWQAMDLPTTNENGTIVGLNPDLGGNDVPGAQGFIHFSIVVDPTNPNLVYVGGDRQPSPFPNSIGATNFTGRLFRGDSSKPLGSQWTPITDNFTANQSAPHADSRHMTFDSRGRLIETDDGGIFTLSSPESSQGIWTSLIGNLTVSEIHNIAYDTNTNTLIAGDQDTGTPEQQAAGNISWAEFTQGDGGDVTVDDSNPNQSIRYTSFAGFGQFLASIYDTNNNLLSVSVPALIVNGTNNATIYAVDGGLPFVTTVKLNSLPGFANQMVIGGGSAVYESFDDGQTLTQLKTAGGALAGGVGPFSLFGAAMAYGGTSGGIADPSVLWVGANSKVLLRSGGVNNFLAPTNYNGGNVRSLVINPNNWRNAIVVDDANHVWLTADGGASYTDISGNLTNSVNGAAPLTADLRSVAFVPGSSTNLIYIGSRDGVYVMQTAQQGVWSRYGAFMPDVPVYSLQYVASQQLLVAGTMGHGAFTSSAIGAAGDITATVNSQNVADDGGVITGTVTRAGTFGNLTVVLNSSDPARVPTTTVTIPDGQTSQTFSINVNDLLDVSGNEVAVPRETVILTPTAGGLNSIGTYVNITEDNPTGATTSDDLPALTVTLSAREMNPNLGVNSIAGTVSRNTPTDQPLTVTLAASDPTRASTIQNGSTTVVIPAGSQSVNFTLSYVDRFANDGRPHWVTVTAAGITYQGLGITSANGDGNDNEDPELADPTGASLDGDESFTVKIDAAQHVLSYDHRGDANVNRDQGQVIIANSRISNSLDYGVVVEPGPRGVYGNFPHPGVPINLSTINSDRIAPGATIENNLLVGNGAGGIQFLGDANAGAGPLAAVPFGRIVNNTVYGGTQQTGVGVQVGQNASPTILNNIFANLATGVSVDNTSSSTHLEGSVYQNDGATLTGSVFNGADLFGITLAPTDPLFSNAANNDFYLASGSKAIDSAINSLSDRPDMISAKSLTGIPASPIYAPSRDLYGQLRVADPETNPSGVGSTLFKDRGAIERVDFTGPTATLANPIDNGSLDQDPTLNVVHEVGVSLSNFAVQLSDGSGVGIDDSTVNASKFAVYRDGVRLNAGIDYFFSYDTNTKTAYFTPATGTWATGHEYSIYLNNGTHFDPNNSAAATSQNAIKDLAANPLQPNHGTGSPSAGFTQFDILLQNTGGDAPSIGVPGTQSTQENTALVFSSFSAAANPITIFNIDAPNDSLTVNFSTSQGTLSLADTAGVSVTGSGTSSLTITGTAAAINAALGGTAAQHGADGFTFTPTKYFFGTATIHISATDPATGLTGTSVATIGVVEVNQAPVITVPPLQTVNENPATPLVFSNATGNAITITDPNNGNGPDQVTITVPNGTVTLSGTTGLTFVQGGRIGSLMTFTGLLTDINAALNGMSYLPANNFTGATSINFSASGQTSGTNPVGTGSAAINVVAVNQPPDLIKQIPNLTVNEVNQTVQQVIDLSQYISDPDVNNTPPEAPPTLLLLGNNNPTLVGATINGHLLTLTFEPYQRGSATITIQAIDNNLVGPHPSITTSFTITVLPVNYPPITSPSEYVYVPGQPLVVTAPGVLANDVDHDNNPLTAVLFQVPNHGKLTLNGDGSFTYVPDAGFNGRDSFIYKVDDGHGNRVPATVYLDSPTSQWVARMYSEVLGRTGQPADAEINYWVGQLNAGMSRTQIANLFVTSPERRSHVIADLYETYLGRPVDPAGLNYWLGVWNANQGPEQVQSGIIGSQEFYNTAGGTPQAWVTALYQNLFERAPDAAGLAYWAGVIQTQSRTSVVLGFVTSDEYRLNLLRGIPNDPDDPDGPSDPNEPNDSGWYMQYLHRPIDQSGAMYWLDQMKAGFPQEAILEGILGSGEYFNRP